MASKLTARAKNLCKDSTDAERLLWSHIRAHRLNGIKFKRQQPLGPYIVDFVCFESKLVVELDGGQHAEARTRDIVREDWIRSQGFHVLRFWNNEVLSNIEGVMQQITAHLSPSPPPSPIQGEGALRESSSGTSPIKGEGV